MLPSPSTLLEGPSEAITRISIQLDPLSSYSGLLLLGVRIATLDMGQYGEVLLAAGYERCE